MLPNSAYAVTEISFHDPTAVVVKASIPSDFIRFSFFLVVGLLVVGLLHRSCIVTLVREHSREQIGAQITKQTRRENSFLY